MVADESKKLKVSDKSDNSEEIDGEIDLSIKKLEEIQDELKQIDEEATDKVLEIKKEYNEVSKHVYDKRTNHIKSIRNFWLAVFTIHPVLNTFLNEEDRKIFKHLNSLEVEDHEDVKSGYSITFNFNLNPYFEDTKIVKSITFLEEGTTKVTNTPIKWKEGKEISNGISQEKKGNKRLSSDISFFSWFSEPEQRGGDDDNDQVYDEEEEE
ncbi:protein SET-like [Trifolium pratense]|uniref:Protein SET-like n=1 Tax=Trifolium pratense TaxID=57577 RepID=A0A2K3M046_TRIPR|nr:protein SET-like [Trifolium pratense]